MNKYDNYDLSILIRMINCNSYYWSLSDSDRNDLINSFCDKYEYFLFDYLS